MGLRSAPLIQTASYMPVNFLRVQSRSCREWFSWKIGPEHPAPAVLRGHTRAKNAVSPPFSEHPAPAVLRGHARAKNAVSPPCLPSVPPLKLPSRPFALLAGPSSVGCLPKTLSPLGTTLQSALSPSCPFALLAGPSFVGCLPMTLSPLRPTLQGAVSPPFLPSCGDAPVLKMLCPLRTSP